MKIIGEKKPIIGVTEMYSVIDSSGALFTSNMNKVTYAWYIFKKYKNGDFVNVTKNNIPKTGQSVPYSFGYNVEYRLDVYKLEKELLTQKDKASFVASYFVNPTKKASKADIKKAVLYNKGAKNVDLAGIGNSLTVRVECINMVGKSVKVHIWNAENKGEPNFMNSKLIDINDKGIGLTQFNVMQLLSPTESMNLMIGNIKAIGFFVTATYEQQSVTNKAPVVVVSQFQSIADIFENARSMSSYKDNDAPESTESCGGKYCIKKGDKNELIREVNIRLAGFGGNVPTDEFTDRTEKMIKQFQRDYMKVSETGKICGNVLKAIDEFSNKFDISETLWKQLKCSCGTKGKQAKSVLRGYKEINNCDGFGDGTGTSTSPEKSNKYEYPGIHRSLLFGFKALQFYFTKQNIYKIDHFTSGYRCRFKNYKTTNHQGKAIDLQFSKGNWEIRNEVKKNLTELRQIRDSIIIPNLGAQKEWPNSNLFSIEPIDLLYDSKGNVRFDHTFSWIHIDVREFNSQYLKDIYFCKSKSKLNGKSIIELAIESGYTSTCNCNVSLNTQNNDNDKKATDRVDPKTLKTSQKGKDFIKSWEKFRNEVYDDSEGYATIGYGYLIAYKSYKSVTKSDIEKLEITWDEFKNGITEKKALELFNKKIDLYEKAVQRDIKVNLYQYEFDALVSLIFNTGQNFLNIGGKNKKETKIKININNHLYSEGADEFSDVTNGGTRGLVERRKDEIDIFNNNNYINHK